MQWNSPFPKWIFSTRHLPPEPDAKYENYVAFLLSRGGAGSRPVIFSLSPSLFCLCLSLLWWQYFYCISARRGMWEGLSQMPVLRRYYCKYHRFHWLRAPLATFLPMALPLEWDSPTLPKAVVPSISTPHNGRHQCQFHNII